LRGAQRRSNPVFCGRSILSIIPLLAAHKDWIASLRSQ
jgi:hypothetical protein